MSAPRRQAWQSVFEKVDATSSTQNYIELIHRTPSATQASAACSTRCRTTISCPTQPATPCMTLQVRSCAGLEVARAWANCFGTLARASETSHLTVSGPLPALPPHAGPVSSNYAGNHVSTPPSRGGSPSAPRARRSPAARRTPALSGGPHPGIGLRCRQVP